jgi:hypothetical protein
LCFKRKPDGNVNGQPLRVGKSGSERFGFVREFQHAGSLAQMIENRQGTAHQLFTASAAYSRSLR